MSPDDIVMTCRDGHMMRIGDIAFKDKMTKRDACGKPMNEML